MFCMRSILLSVRYFPQAKVSGANAPLPLKTPDITTWGGRQITSAEMANKTGLLCSVDDLPPEAGHSNAQVRSLVAGSNIPRKALDMLLTDLDQAAY